jgi:TatA/E family protein of Tat protein translocase
VFSFGANKIIIIAVFALMLFGPDKIPQVARTLGRFMREFNKYKDIMQSTIRMEIYQSEGPEKQTMTVEERIAKAGAASTELLKASGGEGTPAGGADGGTASEAAGEAASGPDGGTAAPAPLDGAAPVPAEAAVTPVAEPAPVAASGESEKEDRD